MFEINFRTDKDDRFQLYLDKTFNKTASLMANSCKSVAILANENNADKNIVVSSYTWIKVVVKLIQNNFQGNGLQIREKYWNCLPTCG